LYESYESYESYVSYESYESYECFAWLVAACLLCLLSSEVYLALLGWLQHNRERGKNKAATAILLQLIIEHVSNHYFIHYYNNIVCTK
jgi:hypothetical protein